MSFLKKMGLSRKSTTKSKIGEDAAERKKMIHLWTKIILITGLYLATVFIFPHDNVKDSSYQIGQVWTEDDLTAPYTFSLLKTDEEIAREREEIISNTPPIFYVNPNARMTIDNRTDSVFANIEPVLESYVTWKISVKNENPESEIRRDSLSYRTIRNNASVGLDSKGWKGLLIPYTQELVRLLKSENEDQSILDAYREMRAEMNTVIDQLLAEGIINISKSDINQSEITIRNRTNRTERTVFLSNVNDLSDARSYASVRLSRVFNNQSSDAAVQLFNLIIEPNYVFSLKETQNRIEEAVSSISNTKGAVAEGQVIIRKGDLINTERLNMLNSLAYAQSKQATDQDKWLKRIGQFLLISAILTVFIYYLFLYRRKIFDDNSMLLLVFLLTLLVVALNAIASDIEQVSTYMVPLAITPIILTIIFDSRVGILSTMTLAMINGLMNGYDFEFVVASIVASTIAVFSVRDIRNRSQFYVVTPLLLFVSYIVVYFGFTLTKLTFLNDFIDHSIYITINAVLNLVLVYPLVLLVEKTFNLTTDVALLELSDTNREIFKEMMLKATGTFHHSLQVANLAENAAIDIGARSLLCRVGALYHDIGKLDKPHYFAENQEGDNEHDKIKPSMSALVIRQHVSKGVTRAEEIGLPDTLIDFIKTHHGNSLISYFYNKAKKSEDKTEINEEDFRYDGPIPSTRETGILMLADSVEASSRALKNPNHNKIHSLVHRIVDHKVDDNQLANCPLTFQDIDKIKETFIKVLSGIYHGRVAYPDDEKQNNLDLPNDLNSTNYDLSDPRSQTDNDSNNTSNTTKKESSVKEQSNKPVNNKGIQTDDGQTEKSETGDEDKKS